jgi:hypothetical protein
MINNIKFQNHSHLCELKWVKGKSWKKFCPFLGKLSWSEEECDDCAHMLIVNLKDGDDTKIDYVERFDQRKKYGNKSTL